MTKYYGLVLEDPGILYTEPLEEIFRERASYCKRINKFNDLWIIKNPSFLATLESNKDKKVDFKNNDTFAIISCDKNLILILNIRISDQAKTFEFEAPSEKIKSPLSYKKS